MSLIDGNYKGRIGETYFRTNVKTSEKTKTDAEIDFEKRQNETKEKMRSEMNRLNYDYNL